MKYNELRQAVSKGIHYGLITEVSKTPNSKEYCGYLFRKYLVSEVNERSHLIHKPTNNHRYYYVVSVFIRSDQFMEFSFKTLGEAYRFTKRCNCSVSDTANIWLYRGNVKYTHINTVTVFNTGAVCGLKPFCSLPEFKPQIKPIEPQIKPNKVNQLLSLKIDKSFITNLVAIIKS